MYIFLNVINKYIVLILNKYIIIYSVHDFYKCALSTKFKYNCYHKARLTIDSI